MTDEALDVKIRSLVTGIDGIGSAGAASSPTGVERYRQGPPVAPSASPDQLASPSAHGDWRDQHRCGCCSAPTLAPSGFRTASAVCRCSRTPSDWYQLRQPAGASVESGPMARDQATDLLRDGGGPDRIDEDFRGSGNGRGITDQLVKQLRRNLPAAGPRAVQFAFLPTK